jgi:hypothetical protein
MPHTGDEFSDIVMRKLAIDEMQNPVAAYDAVPAAGGHPLAHLFQQKETKTMPRRRLARDQVFERNDLGTGGPAELDDGDQEEGAPPPDCEQLSTLVRLCLSKMDGEERDKFLGQLSQLLAASEHINGNGGNGDQSSSRFNGRGAIDKRTANDRAAAPRRRRMRPAMDSAVAELNTKDFLRRFPEAKHIRLGGGWH